MPGLYQSETSFDTKGGLKITLRC